MHILATKAQTLDEGDAAVDLGQSPADVVLLSFNDNDLAAAANAWRADRDVLPGLRLASLKALRHPMSVDLYIESVAAHAKAIVVRALGGLEYWRYGIERMAAVAAKTGAVFIAIPGCDKPDPRLKAYSTASQETVDLLESYFREGGAENVRHALRTVATLIGRPLAAEPPATLGPAVLFASDGRTAAIGGDPAPAASEQPTALIVFYRAQLLAADTAPVTALMQALADEGLSARAVAVTSLKDPDACAAITRLLAAERPSVILNATAFSSLRDDQTSVLDAADVPVLQVVLSGSTRDAWEASPRGLSPTDIAMNVVLPEIDGRILARAISFKAETAQDPDLEFATLCHAPDAGRVAYVAKLAARWAALGAKPERTRRLALILSDYPARGGRAGYAVGLDTSASAAAIVNLLRETGYAIPRSITSRDLAPLLRREAAPIEIPLEEYARWFQALPQPLREDIERAWGPPGDDPAVIGGSFVLPALTLGNVVVALQPCRGAASGKKQSYHDIALPPRHAYVAFYAWLRESFGIDAVIHLGTHGTLEWLPGKALALSETCAPEAVLGPLPVVYPFIVNNPGEAVQAKRRISAVTIGHLTPPLSAAGLNGPLADLEALIEEFAEADGVDRRRASLLEAEIVERAWASGLAADCGLLRDDAPRDAIAKLDAQLCDIKELAVRDRLHVFGEAPDAEANRDLASSIAATSGLAPNAIDALVARSAAAERAALLAALSGRRVAPGPAGAPSRGRADVLPTGRNLTTIDPRGIPTRTAAIVGERGAREVVTRFMQDHGDYPKALVLDLWASASLRTGGDDLAQALAYLGVKPAWDPGSNRVTGVEVIPEPKLERPRIDVTLRISGLFRDIFASQIALFEMAVGLVASLDEDDAWNPLAGARRRGESLDRIFGAAPGVYGAAAASLALDGLWQSEADLGAAYLESAAYAFSGDETARPAGDAFRDRIIASDALVHAQDDRERDILDGDGVADFVGGYAAAAAMLGRTVPLYHLDTSRPEAPRVRTIPEEITRIVRGRLANPRWIAGMLAHGHRGAAEIAQGVDALYAFAATARAVPSHLFDAVHDALLHDDATTDALRHANPEAADAIAARLEDAIARRLWTPRRNAVGAELARLRGTALARLEAAQ